MFKKFFSAIIILLLSGCNVSNLLKQSNKPVFREKTEWSIFYAWDNNSDKPRVLAVGDSIANGYVHNLKKIDDKRTYSLFATSKSVCDPAYIKELENVLIHNKYAIITFNNGIHGTEYSLEHYRDSYKKVIQKIKQLTHPAKIAVVLSTPESQNTRQYIIDRNKVCAEIAGKNSFAVIDLYRLVKGHPGII